LVVFTSGFGSTLVRPIFRLDMASEFSSYRPGDREDFDRLYRESYHRILYTLLAVLRNREAAEDCAQETFVRAYRAWSRWKADAPAEAWLHRIALNTASSFRRAERRRGFGSILRQREPETDLEPHGESHILLAVRRLPPRDAALIVLRHLHGYSNREIAAALNLPESTISSRLVSARRTLQRELRVDDLVTRGG